MGYEVRRTILLEFEDPDGGEGAWVRLTSMSIAELRAATEKDENGELAEANRVLAEHIVGWNLELDSKPLEIGYDGVCSLDIPLRDMILSEWMRAVRAVPHPLVLKSDGGAPSEAPPMTMEDL